MSKNKLMALLAKHFRKIVISIDGKMADLINKAQEDGMLLSFNEAQSLYSLALAAQKIQGDMAEVGVYRGGSAKLICEVKGDKALHLFDTFEGHPETSKWDPATQHKGRFMSSYDQVKRYLEEYKNVYFYKGIFPNTAEYIKNKNFSFVHLDVDLYKSTFDCLDFFYPRMNKGGIILSHDYPILSGVKKAFDEFFKDKPEPMILTVRDQCLIVKV